MYCQFSLLCALSFGSKLSVLAKWLARKTPLNCGKGIVSRKPRPKSAYDFLGLLWHYWLGDRKGIWPLKKLGVGLLVVMIWLELCMSHSSSCHHSPPPSSLASTKSRIDILVPANPGPPGKCFIVLLSVCDIGRGPTWYICLLLWHSIVFVLKVPLNTKQTNKQE